MLHLSVLRARFGLCLSPPRTLRAEPRLRPSARTSPEAGEQPGRGDERLRRALGRLKADGDRGQGRRLLPGLSRSGGLVQPLGHKGPPLPAPSSRSAGPSPPGALTLPALPFTFNSRPPTWPSQGAGSSGAPPGGHGGQAGSRSEERRLTARWALGRGAQARAERAPKPKNAFRESPPRSVKGPVLALRAARAA